MSTTRRARWVGLTVLLLWLVAAEPAAAHVQSTTGYSQIRSEDGAIRYELSLEYEFLARAVGLGSTALAATDEGERAAALRTGHDAIETYLAERVEIFLDEVGCDAGLQDTGIEERQGKPFAALDLVYECHGATAGPYRVDYAVFSGTGADAVVDDHTNIVDYRLDGEQGRAVLDAGHRGFVAGERSLASATARFVGLGFEHILAGLDHVLFVVALLLGATTFAASTEKSASAGTFAAVAKVVSMFTLAHSVTLALAVLGWVHVPAEIVEPLIALSIAYVAVANLLGGQSRQQLAVVFGFGLLHGLGFAGALRFNDELSWSLVTSLVGFNIGIELGQALLVVVLFPLLLVIRRFRWSSLAHLTATSAVAVMGLTWFAQRLI